MPPLPRSISGAPRVSYWSSKVQFLELQALLMELQWSIPGAPMVYSWSSKGQFLKFQWSVSRVPRSIPGTPRVYSWSSKGQFLEFRGLFLELQGSTSSWRLCPPPPCPCKGLFLEGLFLGPHGSFSGVPRSIYGAPRSTSSWGLCPHSATPPPPPSLSVTTAATQAIIARHGQVSGACHVCLEAGVKSGSRRETAYVD